MTESHHDVYVIGAGVAGLIAAHYLARTGLQVCVLESSPQSGGRCRTYRDKQLLAEIDNGNHLITGAYGELLGLLQDIGAMERFRHFPMPAIPVYDAQHGTRAAWDIGNGFSAIQPFTLRDMWASFRLMQADDFTLVGDCTHGGTVFQQRLNHLCRSMLNTTPKDASAKLFWRCISLLRKPGGRDWYLPNISWQDALISPLEQAIIKRKGEIRYGQNVRTIRGEKGTASMLEVGEDTIFLKDSSIVIVATPSTVTQTLLPYVKVPAQQSAIINVHFLRPKELPIPELPVPAVMVTGGTAEWVFIHSQVISTTLSAVDWEGRDEEEVEGQDAMALAHWHDVCAALGWPSDTPIPAYRILVEKRATFAATPKNLLMRPEPKTAFSNVYLAGDYVENNLPATLESAAISARRAVGAAFQQIRRQHEREAA